MAVCPLGAENVALPDMSEDADCPCSKEENDRITRGEAKLGGSYKWEDLAWRGVGVLETDQS